MLAPALVLLVGIGLAAPPAPRPRDASRPAPRRVDQDDDDALDARRRAPEPSPAGPSVPLDVEEQPLVLSLRERETVCTTTGWSRVREALMAAVNDSQLTSLELWGDKDVYHVFDEVLFHMRAPRGVYVTLWWLGPDDHIIVVLDNVRIPAERNITVETGGIIVPPLGTERWVAIATLEPVPVGCRSEAAMLKNIQRRKKLEHGVGRWDVISQ